MKIDVVLPVLNEAEAMCWVLGRMPPAYEAIVVDNGSTDDSVSIASRFGARIVHESRRGFGAACYAGLLAATAEIVCFMDCDGSLDPSQLDRVTSELSNSNLVLGRRTGPSFSLRARLCNKILTSEIKRRTGLQLQDLGPMRAARRDALLDLNLEDRRFGWPLEMVIKAHSAGWRVNEVDVGYLQRAGKSKVTGTLFGTVRTIKDMAAVFSMK